MPAGRVGSSRHALHGDGPVGGGYSLDQLITLDPDTVPPRFLDPPFDVSPRPGSKVEAGDEIGFEVNAVEQNPPKVWQTGVHTLEVTGPHGPIGGPQQAGVNAKACEAKSKSLTIQGTYRVRRSDPAVIELCAVADDYVPNENKKCAQWYKGEVWEGKGAGHLTVPDCTPTNPAVDTHMSLTVDSRGNVKGTAGYTSASYTCGGVEAPAFTSPEFPVTGRKTRDAFRIQLEGEPATMRIADHEASTTFDVVGNGGYASTLTYAVKCLDCDERVG